MSISTRSERVDATRLSRRVGNIGTSATLAAGEKARRLQRRGVEVFDLGPGQPDFDTPAHIRAAGERAIRDGHTRYTPSTGILELREAIGAMFGERDGVEYRPEETMVTCGGKQGLFNAVMALVNPGDEVIIPTPFWVTFPEQVRLAGGNPVLVDTAEEDGFALRAAVVAEACTEQTRMIVVNTPGNPSGAVIPRTEMEALVQLALERGITLLFDECYAQLVYAGAEHVTPIAVDAAAKEITVMCGSCSKSYAMTGWRVGYVAAPRSVVEAMARLQGHTTSNTCSISQWAALAAITGDQTPVQEMLAVFSERRDRVLPLIRSLPGVNCVEPQGAFYAFPNVGQLLSDQVPTSADLATELIDRAHVVTVPGTAFGRDGYLRLSFATSMEVLEGAVDRLRGACEELLG